MMKALLLLQKTKVSLFFLLLIYLSVPPTTYADNDRGLKALRDKYQQKSALLIGNSAYKVSPLKNPANDAQDMAAVLRKIGFDVTLKINASQREMETAIRAFGKKLRNGGSGLFYYAGHGIQINGRNFLIPVGATIESESDVKYEAVDAGLLLGKMEDAGNDLNIVILDACRNNPFARSFRSGNRGLARMDAPKGSLVAYATAPGSVAADGSGKNGIYTKHLINTIKKPGLTIEQVLKQVRIAVVGETGNKQIPWESSSLMGNFYFTPGDSHPTVNQSVPVPTQQIDEEEELWFLVRKSSDPRDFTDFLGAYPNGRFTKHARLKLKQLTSGSRITPEEKEDNKDISFSTSAYKITDIRFYEAGATSPEASKRVYINEFSKARSRRIYTEVKIKNLRYKEEFHSHKLKWIYYNPNGSIRCEMYNDFNVKKEWLNAWSSKGWGWNKPGKWPIGKYRVKVYIDGTYIDEKAFYIKSSSSEYKVTSIRFFEAGDKAPDASDRQYATRFKKKKTKRIYTELKIKNYQYQKAFHQHKVEWVYYNPDGSVRCRMESDFNVKKIWKNSWVQKGWGWTDAGNWPKGIYRVKVFIDAEEVDEKTYTIY